MDDDKLELEKRVERLVERWTAKLWIIKIPFYAFGSLLIASAGYYLIRDANPDLSLIITWIISGGVFLLAPN